MPYGWHCYHIKIRLRILLFPKLFHTDLYSYAYYQYTIPLFIIYLLEYYKWYNDYSSPILHPYNSVLALLSRRMPLYVYLISSSYHIPLHVCLYMLGLLSLTLPHNYTLSSHINP